MAILTHFRILTARRVLAAVLTLITIGLLIIRAGSMRDRILLIRPRFEAEHPMEFWVYEGSAYFRVWVSGPFQRIKNDSWRIGIGRYCVGYSGTYEAPGCFALHGVYYDTLFPVWLPAAACATYPFIAFLGMLRHAYRSRVNRSHCKACGYNLTGNVSGICTECGVEIPKPITRARVLHFLRHTFGPP